MSLAVFEVIAGGESFLVVDVKVSRHVVYLS